MQIKLAKYIEYVPMYQRQEKITGSLVKNVRALFNK